MKLNSFEELYVDQLRDLYAAENQLVKALAKMAEASASEELRQDFEALATNPQSCSTLRTNF